MTNLKLRLFIILFSSTFALADLPPRAQVDRYLVQVEKVLEANDINYDKAARLTDKVIALKNKHNLQLPKVFYFKYAKILLGSSESGKGNKAWISINKYLSAIDYDEKNKNYIEALDLYQQALDWRLAEVKTANELQQLLDLGAEVNAKNYGEFEWQFGHTYKYNDNPAVIKALIIAVGVDVHTKDYVGDTPLHRVARYDENPAIIEALIAVGAKVNAKNEDKWIPLHLAAGYNKNPAIIKALITAGEEVNAKDYTGDTPLHFAAEYNKNPSIIKALVAAGAKVNVKDKQGDTPLHNAAEYNENPAIIKALVAAGAKVNVKDKHGNTPLHYAVKYNENPAVKDALIAAGGRK